jgi:magnesium chelatase family protein
MAPADLKKEGPCFDLPFALGILTSNNVLLLNALRGLTILGELALDGRVKPVAGTLAAAILAQQIGHRGIMVAAESRSEAELVKGLEVVPTYNLKHAVSLLGGPPYEASEKVSAHVRLNGFSQNPANKKKETFLDYQDVMGQEAAKEAMIVAAAGGHNLLMIGPPGSGKTMLARRLPSIFPPLNRKDSLEVSRIHSIARQGLCELMIYIPFRSPHHTISYGGLVGGGPIPKPGEISLAHKGILFLDELPEFQRRTLEALRQPLEEGVVHLSRVRGTISLPARILFVASMNPCPCGFRGDPRNQCVCTPRQVNLYIQRISGPLLDRVDLQIEIPPLAPALFRNGPSGLDSKTMAASVLRARGKQMKRETGGGPVLNAHLDSNQIKRVCSLSSGAAEYLNECLQRYPLSARGYTRILKVARTLADLEATATIHTTHMEKAVMFRVLDRLKIREDG